jgi:hypothetical protein
MDIMKYFEYNPTLDLTAAHIGINKWEWETIDSESEEMAKEKMRVKKYDVLPILNSDGKVLKYFSTRVWNNYDKLNLNNIEQANSIYYRLSLADLIRKFHEENRHYYFLTNHKDVLGLVSYVNLNCQAVYNFLFQIIADIERSIASLLKKRVNQNDILQYFKSSSDTHLNELAKTFEDAAVPGQDNTIFEHMYLQTVGITLNKFCNQLPDNFKKLNKYSSKFSPDQVYGKLRNKVMHPVRPILNDTETIKHMDELLRDYSDIKEILRENPDA